MSQEDKKSLCIKIAGRTFLIKIKGEVARNLYVRLKEAFEGFIVDNRYPVQIIKITDSLSPGSKTIPSWKPTPKLEPDIFKFTPLAATLRSGGKKEGLEIFASKKILTSLSLWRIFLDKLILYLSDCIIAYPDIMLLHCAACVKDNKGYLFLGPSKSGKTTVAKLAKDCAVLSDDRALVRKTAKQYRIYPLPLLSYESHRLHRNIPGSVIIDKIFLLRKSKVIRFKRVSRALAMVELLERAKDLNRMPRVDMRKLFGFSYGMGQAIPAYTMHFKKRGRFFIP